MNGDDKASDRGDELESALMAIGAPVTVEVSTFGAASLDVRIDGVVMTLSCIERAHPSVNALASKLWPRLEVTIPPLSAPLPVRVSRCRRGCPGRSSVPAVRLLGL